MKIKNILEKIKKVDWQYLVSRKERLLFISFTNHSYNYFSKLTGISWRPKFAFRSPDLGYFLSTKELDKLYSIFLKGGIKIFLNLRRSLIFYVKSFDKIAQKIEKTNCSNLTQRQLISLLNEYIQAALRAHCFLDPMPIADQALSQKIIELLPLTTAEEKQRVLNVLIFPSKENAHLKEKRSFYNLVKLYKTKDKNFDRLLTLHLRNFAWIGARWYHWENSWQKKDILVRLKDFLKVGKNPVCELKNLERIKKEKVDAARKLMKILHIDRFSQLYKLIQIAREYIFLKLWRTDILYRAGFRARNLFYEIAKRANFPKDGVVYLTFKEILVMTRTKKWPISSKILRERKNFYAGLLLNNQHLILAGNEWKRKLISIFQSQQKQLKQIQGDIASAGRAKGVAKIVYDVSDLNKVKQGDILVAVMTFPPFVPAMEKASAFVTDEGGILCHAAIIARELKKPCIIGTKIATKILKDGDLVEVDANKGVIRILKTI
jgi:phosphohistidine swiveling domain-containing protein